jgi:hypothetical protein
VTPGGDPSDRIVYNDPAPPPMPDYGTPSTPSGFGGGGRDRFSEADRPWMNRRV